MDVEIRVPAASEVDELAALDYGIFGEPGYSVISLRQFFDLAGPLLKVAVHGGLIGYSLVLPSYDGVSGWFLACGVRADWRGRGVGRALTVAALDGADATAVRTLRLTVLPDNHAAVGLYRSLGFTDDGMAADYYGAGADRLVMLRHRPARPGARQGTT
ncbi:MAG: [ribosomal protein S18]-alanine N-acetyltransferase [Mycobacteriales bacterium]|jgi:ribosomal protein S18 acetylase RimI-like enzyme